jgi:dUTP pyrophosphatase
VDHLAIQVARLPHGADLPLPSYSTAGAAGMDLMAAVDEPVELAPGERRLIPTGIRIAVPPGYEAQVRPRSGLALKRGLGVPNAPGTIDSDYRGELCVIMINWSAEPQTIRRGDRIAQLVICPVEQATLIEVHELDETERADGGFGHTGVEARARPPL